MKLVMSGYWENRGTLMFVKPNTIYFQAITSNRGREIRLFHPDYLEFLDMWV